MIRKTIIGIVILSSIINGSGAQHLPVPQDIGNKHPRVFGKNMSLEKIKELSQEKYWASEIIDRTKDRLSQCLQEYQKDPDWLSSRLQMYWETKSIQVYIQGGIYSHAEGKAPAPTVKFPGTRDHRTNYVTPDLDDVKPYMDDVRGLYLQRRDNKQWEWTDMVSSARIVESVNRNILGLARDAAFLYWFTGDEDYAKLAYGVLDAYLTGLYYRTEPIDLSHGHHQTLVGLTSFEVIQEHQIAEVTQAYDFLHSYISENYPEKLDLYAQALQKWADQVIKNGVSFNNWNLFQAGHVSKIALVLENDSEYKNGKGAQYYLDRIMNQTSVRQWSMSKMINYGYDSVTGIWNESPGYAMGVLRDFIHFAKFYDHTFDIDLIEELPVLKQAVKSSAQYLYPNTYTVAFGDGHYKKLSPEPIMYMIENARKYGRKKDEAYFTKMQKTLFGDEIYNRKFSGNHLSDLFIPQNTHPQSQSMSGSIHGGKLSDFTSPLFYASNTSWLVQRLGEGENGLMISQIGSLGNHMHSNGIAMELYGYGLPLAPEMGHGSSYFSIEYNEYYTQFPAHNTVIVNGKSKYPEMKSNHAFEMVASYPESEKEGILPGYTFSDVTFLEPETNSEQRRVMGIVKNGEATGYYVDIFRSRQNTGNNIKHEYFYHNLGQEFTLTDKEGKLLDLKPTDRLAFGDGDLMAYDYLWDKKSIRSDGDIRGKFDLTMDDRTISMNVWMKGEKYREIFSALSPKSTAFRHGPLPDELAEAPVPTLVVKQEGEAWTRPFAAIYEPALNGENSIASVDYFGHEKMVGIQVNSKTGRQDFLFSATNSDRQLVYQDMTLEGTYAIVSKHGDDFTLFLGSGKLIRMGDFKIEVSGDYNAAALVLKAGQWYWTSEAPAILTIPVDDTKRSIILKDQQGKTYKGETDKKTKSVSFRLPQLFYGPIQIAAGK